VSHTWQADYIGNCVSIELWLCCDCHTKICSIARYDYDIWLTSYKFNKLGLF